MRVKRKKEKNYFDIREEQLLKQDWSYKKHHFSEYKKNLLITGANSFIGVHVLVELFENWNNEIHILIRAKNIDNAKERMDKAFESWGLPSCQHDKIIYHVGDLFQVNWGLNNSEYNNLQKNIGHVLHLALNAKYHIPYSNFQKNWLPEFIRMLEYCGNEKYPKSFHYTGSYVSHFFITDDNFSKINTSVWHSGYSAFKWVVERILRQAFSANLRGCFYDIPLVLGSSKTGIGPQDYFAWQLAEIFLQTGVYTKFNFTVISSDILSKIIAQNLLNEITNCASNYVRPVFKESITEKDFISFFGTKNNLREGTINEVAEKHIKPSRVKFFFPDGLYDLVKNVHALKPVLPIGIDENLFPGGIETFYKNMEYLYKVSSE